MATKRYYSAIAVDNTVASGISSTATSVVLSSSPIGFPSSYPFTVALDYDNAAEEIVLVTNVVGTTMTITRGYNGSAATAHNAGATVRHVIVAQDLTDTQDHYALGLTGGAHGVTGALATFLGAPSSTNLAALVTDETGTGPIAFSQSPSLVTPTISGGSLTGSITALGASITGPTISSATISGGSITGSIAASGATINGPTISGPSISGATISGGSITGATITGAAISSSKFSIGINANTGSAYTLVASDQDKLVTLNNSGAVTVTVPASVFSVGAVINIQQIGAGQVTVQGDGTSTITGTGTKTRAQYSGAAIICVGTNAFTMVGDIA